MLFMKESNKFDQNGESEMELITVPLEVIGTARQILLTLPPVVGIPDMPVNC
jgi:hypothetical protein